MFEENNFTQQNSEQPQHSAVPQSQAQQTDAQSQTEIEAQNQYQSYGGYGQTAQYMSPVIYIPYGFTPETYREKRDIRKIALVVAIPCLLLSLITLVWSFVYLFFTTKFLNLDYNSAIELANNPAVQQILQIILSIFMFLVPFPIAAKLAGYRIDNLIQFSKPKRDTALPFFLFGVGFCSFANIAMSYSSAFFSGIGIEYDVDYGENPSGFFGFLLSFTATAIIPALVEEFACRGIVLGALKKYGQTFAIVASSIVFGIMHGNFDQMPFAVMVGLILGYIYVKTGSIWISIAVHGVNNAVSVIFTYLSNSVSNNLQNLLYIVYLMISMIAALLGIYVLAKRGKENYTLEKSDSAATEKQKYTWFFTSWAIILFVVFNLIESLSYFVI